MKYYLQVFGCQMNLSDGERFKSVLEQLNYEETQNEDDADIIAVVACSVRQKSVDRIHGRSRKWMKMKKKRPLITALSGCVIEEDRKKFSSVFDIFFDIKDLSSFPSLLGKHVGSLPEISPPDNYFMVRPQYSSRFQAYVPISTGCNNYCTFCVVPYTRGKEISRSFDDVVGECRSLVNQGYKEIMLLGQNVNSYGLDDLPPRMITSKGRVRFREKIKERKTFPDLLKKVADIPGDFWVRFMTSNPQDFDYRLIEVIADHPKIAKYIHLPIQSGNDDVLQRMNRRYKREQYTMIVDRIREKIPNVTLTTDIIVGFCDETEEQFYDSLQATEQYKYDMAFTAQYSHRPGTSAYRAFRDNVPQSVKKGREKRLTKAIKRTAYEGNMALIGSLQKVLVERYDNGMNFARTEGWKPICFPGDDHVGKFIDVKISDATPWHLTGDKA